MKNVVPSIDIIQKYISCGLLLHPIIEEQFNSDIRSLEWKGKVSLLPLTKLVLYNKHLDQLQKTG